MFFTSEVVSPTPEVLPAIPPKFRINPALAVETIMASPVAAAMKDHADSPEDPPAPLTASDSVTCLRPQTSESKVQRMTLE